MENIKEKTRTGLASLADQMGQALLAEKVNYAQSSLSRFITGKSQSVSFDAGLRFLEALNATVVFPDEKIPESYDFEDYALIPKVKAKLGAGSSLIVDDEPDGLYAFRKEFLARVGIHGKKDGVLFGIIGDSMIPTFFPDDSVLVAVNQKEIISGKYYAIRINEEIHIKRLETLISGGLRIHSENKDLYPPQDTKKVDDVYIIGRVRWSGRVF